MVKSYVQSHGYQEIFKINFSYIRKIVLVVLSGLVLGISIISIIPQVNLYSNSANALNFSEAAKTSASRVCKTNANQNCSLKIEPNTNIILAGFIYLAISTFISYSTYIYSRQLKLNPKYS